MKRAGLFASVILAIAVLQGPAGAVQPGEALADPALEARARTLSAELRCMVCQNQSIDLSDAELAHDLRILVRERLMAGDSDEQVLDYVVSRYGEFVLLKPRLSLRNALLWGTPVLLLVAGVGVLFFPSGGGNQQPRHSPRRRGPTSTGFSPTPGNRRKRAFSSTRSALRKPELEHFL